MKRSSHYGKLIPLIVLVSLVFAALTPTAAFAEGDIPEAPATPPVVEDPAEEETPAQVVELLAESGAVIVQDGEPLPLASQGALDGLCDPDPWYYGAGITPNCVGGICRYTVLDYAGSALTYALNEWGANKGYGFIYIEHDINQYLLGNKSIDANDSGYATLKGLIGVPGTLGPTPSIQGSLSFTGFTAGFTIQGLYIHDSSETILRFVSNKGTIKIIDTEVKGSTAAEAILIDEHAGAVELNRVSVHNNTGRGIDIDTCNKVGDVCGYVGTVKVTNSAFYNNGLGTPAEGIYIVSGGAITLNGVSVFSNNGTGLKVNGYSSLTIKNSAFKGNTANTDTDRGYGIRIGDDSKGNILLENLYVSDNGKSGLWLYTNTGSITLKKVQVINNGLDTNNADHRYGVEIGDLKASFPEKPEGALNVTISDSLFTDNYSDNLLILAKGTVTLTNVLANGSKAGYGTRIFNTYNSSIAPVMVVNSTFNENNKIGLQINSYGSVTLNTFNANFNNGSNGLLVNNTNTPFRPVGITILSTYGINRIQNDPAAVSAISGAFFLTPGNLTINNLEVFGHSGIGVSAQAYGSITWKGGGAWDNTNKSGSGSNETGGAKLWVSPHPAIANIKPVTVMNARFDDNLYGAGLYIETSGQVTLTNVSASSNRYNGVKVDAGLGVSILRTLPFGDNEFSNNGTATEGSGVYITAGKNIILTRVQAHNNEGAGAYLNSSGGSVTVTGTSTLPATFTANDGIYYEEGAYAGLEIHAFGAVTLSNIYAANNQGAGLLVDSGSSVKLIGVRNEFYQNSQGDFVSDTENKRYAVHIKRATGTVTLSNLFLRFNGGGGVLIDNTAGLGNVTVNSTVAGVNSVIEAGGDTWTSNINGLRILSKGAVTVTRIDVSDQAGDGLYISNETAPVSKPVSVTLSSLISNSGDGMEVISAGAITVNKVTANENNDYGAYLYNDRTLLTGQVRMPITVLNSTFNTNEDSGAEVYSYRTITISSVTANGNKGYGINLQNDDDFASSVLVTGKNQFNGNDNEGLYIYSKGFVTVNGVEAGNSVYSDGIYIETYKLVTISNSWVYGNDSNGIVVYYAPVTISNDTSMGNGYYGLDVEYVPVGGKVKLLNSTFILNTDAGINIDFDSDLETDLIMFNVNYFGNNGGGENIIIN
jgi:hypothetical protein